MKTTHGLLFGMTLMAAGTVVSAEDARSGEAVFKSVCAACHAANVPKAPQLGDAKAWQPLLREGQVALTAQAWVGVRGMPARGGVEDLSLRDFSRAVAFMARAGGGDWADPTQALYEKIEKRAVRLLERRKAKAGG